MEQSMQFQANINLNFLSDLALRRYAQENIHGD